MDAAPRADPRRTKLVCTLGPATGERVTELVTAGMDVARLNFSHGTPALLASWARATRDAAAVLVDRLALVHGVTARTCVPPEDTTGRLGLMAWLLGEDRAAPAGAPVVLVASTAEPGSGPNVLEVHRVPAR